MKWKIASLGEVATIERNGIDASDIVPGTEFLGLEHIQIGGEIIGSQRVENGEISSTKFCFGKSHVLYGKLRPYLAKIALPNFEGICSTDILPIAPGPNLDRRYLAYYLRQPSMVDLANSRSTGANLPRLSPKVLETFQIPLPPIAEQRRIAAILDKADAIRRKRKQAIQYTEELLRATFLDMFGDPVTNPKGWDVKTIEDFTRGKNSIKRGPFGGALKKDCFVKNGYLVYEQYHALNNDFEFGRYYIDETKFEEMKAFEVHPGDIIISCSGVYLGKLAIVPEGARRGIINQALLRLTLNKGKMSNLFFVYHFSHENFRSKFFGDNRGSGIPNFPPMSEFKQFPFIVPPIDKQRQFEDRFRKIQACKEQEHKSLIESDNLFNSLLKRAFQGEL
ncbi:hypothetical protein C7293_12705 [filamentous cyanobacterium CCT1]|nr:hypothetical protein C7293_12705 [filamentous cyanobacterium CCT1]PSN80543.1 hypothetical protein C8B47_05985 [filamentous cyanobacterium CCP4]